jgi:hypothetical protein
MGYGVCRGPRVSLRSARTVLSFALFAVLFALFVEIGRLAR